MSTPTIAHERPAAASGQRTLEVAGTDGARYTVLLDRILGIGSRGVLVEARSADGAPLAAKLYRRPSGPYAWRDRRDRRAVLTFLERLVHEHPLGARHFNQTHLMPVYAHDTVLADACGGDIAGEPAALYDGGDVVVMARCERSYEGRSGVPFEEIRNTVLPQASEALRLLHEQRIVHRNIKPSSLLVLEGQLVVGDFDIASIVRPVRTPHDARPDRRPAGFSTGFSPDVSAGFLPDPSTDFLARLAPRSLTAESADDWRALGNTVWALYSGGASPDGDQPQTFVPREPAHTALGDLIRGLTCADPRERLGYDGVMRWLADASGPCNAHDDRPNASWHGAETPNACFELVSRTPLGFYRWMDGHGAGAGATRAARATAAEKGCAPGIADLVDLLATLAAMNASCRDAALQTAAWLVAQPEAGALERADKMLGVFSAACIDPEPVRTFELRWGPLGHIGWLLRHADLYEALDTRGDELLRRMREMLRHETPRGGVPRGETPGRATTQPEVESETGDAGANVAARTFDAQRGARNLYDMVRAAAEASPYVASVGITEPQTHLVACTPTARFSDEFYGIPVPAGYLDEMIASSRGAEDALEHALTTMRGVHANRLNRAAARQAFEYARRLDHAARCWEPAPLVEEPTGEKTSSSGRVSGSGRALSWFAAGQIMARGAAAGRAAAGRAVAGQAEAAHFATTLLYVTLALIAACAWPHVTDALVAQGRLFAGSGPLDISGALVRALCDLAFIGFAGATCAVAIPRLMELGRRLRLLSRVRQIRALADDLRADGAVLATGADVTESQRVRIDVEEYLYDLVMEEPLGDRLADGLTDRLADRLADRLVDELADYGDEDGRFANYDCEGEDGEFDETDGADGVGGSGRIGDDGRFWHGAFWVGAGVCAASVGLAGIGSVPFLVADLVGFGPSGLLAQAVYALLGVAAFVCVARVRPVRDPLTLTLLVCSPILPYFAAVGLALSVAAGLVCAASNRLFRLL